jgi:hypothetical protein
MVFSATLTYVHPAPKRLSAHQAQQMTPQEKIGTWKWNHQFHKEIHIFHLERLIEIASLRKQRKVFDLTRSFGTAETLVETRFNCSGLAEKVGLRLDLICHLQIQHYLLLLKLFAILLHNSISAIAKVITDIFAETY